MGAVRTLWVNCLITLFAPVVWGSTYLVTTECLPPDRPLLASVMRALPAGLLLLLLGRRLPQGVWWWRVLALGVLNIGAFFYLLFVAAYLLPGGVAALVMTSQPAIVLVLGVVLLRQAIFPVQVLACALALLGVAFVVLRPGAMLDSVGLAAGVAGAFSMALGLVLSKRWGWPPNVGLLTFTGWQLTVGGLVLLPALFGVEGLPDHLTTTNYLGFGYLSLVGALLAYALWFRGIERLPALSVSFLSLASPLSAVMLGFVFLDQRFGFFQCLGTVLVVISVVLAQPNALSRFRK